MNDIPEKPTAQIIKGPWKKRNVKVPTEAEQRLREELEFAEDLIDQLQFMYDQGFRAIEDNGMKNRSKSDQNKIAKKMDRILILENGQLRQVDKDNI